MNSQHLDGTGSARSTDSPDIQSLLVRLMAAARTSALEEMASGLAHELNQPLGAIATYSQAAERMLTKSPPMVTEAAEALRQISSEALNAGEGIRRIRRLFSRESLQQSRCSIPAILKELMPLLEVLARGSHVALSIDIQPAVPDTLADTLKIQHVLFTLIQNAIQSERDANVRPEVKVSVASDRYSVEVAVTDNGVGIPQAQQAQIFRPFYTTKEGGTGLGLASSRAIVELHEGKIGFKSEAGTTRFWFALPAIHE